VWYVVKQDTLVDKVEGIGTSHVTGNILHY
ncbi:hypothetical protein LCGC14_2448950, partial [marine sediment metagenome]